MSFDDKPHDESFESPLAYQPVEFITQALQHSNVKLTWDTEDAERVKTTRRKFSKDDLKDMDFKAYLASDSESEVDQELYSKYKALVAESDNENGEEDMEITFAPGLSEKASRRIEELKEEKV